MRFLAERVEKEVSAFWQQREDLVLVLQASEVDLPPVLKIVEGLSERSASVWPWIFSQPFDTVDRYVDTIVTDAAARRNAIDATLKADGKPGLPPVPAEMTHLAALPEARMRATCLYVRDLVPIVPGGVTVFGLLPTEGHTLPSYAHFVTALVQHEIPFPWCSRVRFLLRDDPVRPMLAALCARPRVRLCHTDFSPPALHAALIQEASDPGTPPDARMTAAIIAAGMDEAHGRTTEALAAYQEACDHFGAAGNPIMASLAAHGIAGCNEKLGNFEAAERIWLAALNAALASKPPALPVILNVLLALVMLVARQKRWFEAEAYAGATGLVANVLFMPGVKAEAELRCGIARQRQAKFIDAETAYRESIATADAAGEINHAIAARQFLAALLERWQGRDPDAQTVRTEIARLQHPASYGSAHA